ncbi:multicopper oxidase domain-containing protein, partial [Actinomadura sp. DSM 109109]|nr:multicopper oxidase domain-containing protein [Actinomadura lepetitiana]
EETADADAAAGSDVADMAGMDHSEMSEEETAAMMDKLMVDSMLAYPAETEGVGNQLLDHRVMPDGTKQFELTAAVTPWEVAPGQFVDAWAYNGMVPGPTIKVDVGDKVRVIVHNETPMGTDIHWHGIMVPNEQDGVSPYTQEPIPTGES